MPQETNLNVAPYFDDFDPDKNYYKVLFSSHIQQNIKHISQRGNSKLVSFQFIQTISGFLQKKVTLKYAI